MVVPWFGVEGSLSLLNCAANTDTASRTSAVPARQGQDTSRRKPRGSHGSRFKFKFKIDLRASRGERSI